MALREGLPGTIYRKDYAAPEFAVTTVDLLVQISPGRTEVTATLDVVRQGSGQGGLKLENTSLEGFYRSQSAYCTQCEAEGFRKITYFPDRPDVLAVYTVTLEADRAECPVLLSNGNKISEEDL